jgi:hypothetical protein
VLLVGLIKAFKGKMYMNVRKKSQIARPVSEFETVEKFLGKKFYRFSALEKDPNTFDMKKTEFRERVKDKCGNDEKVKTSALHDFSGSKSLNLCIAAKERNGRIQPAFLTNKVERPQVYRFVYSKDRIEDRVAIKCPTFPALYVYFKNLRENEDIQVTFVEKQSPSKTKSEA